MLSRLRECAFLSQSPLSLCLLDQPIRRHGKLDDRFDDFNIHLHLQLKFLGF